MKLCAKLTIERDYSYDFDEYLKYEQELTEEQFKKRIEHWITDDFERIIARAGNVIGDFNYKIDIEDKNE